MGAMTGTTSSAGDFFQRARREARRYGDDPWVFLRELTQNSRDAGATAVDFTTSVEDGWQILACRDNGSGMSADHIDRYFLRLYASSKEQEEASIGFFGVGFWSVLLFEPEVIRVTANHQGQTRSFEIDCRHRQVRAIDPSPRDAGTEIVLYRRETPARGDADALAKATRAKLGHYAAHVRPLRPGGALTLTCNGDPLNRPFSLPPKMGVRFRAKRFDGTLGFGPRPSVRFYKGGVLAREMLSLDEAIPSRKSRLPVFSGGLYPVVRLNIDGLELLMDRRRVFEDPLLYEAIEDCETRLRRLHAKMVRRLFPMDWRNRLLRAGDLARRHVKAAAGLALAAATILLAVWLWPARSDAAIPGPAGRMGGGPPIHVRTGFVDRALENWRGPIVNQRNQVALDWQFRYSGPSPQLFSFAAFDAYDPTTGFKPPSHANLAPYGAPPPGQRDADDRDLIHVVLRLSRGERLFPLPVAYGYALAGPPTLSDDARSAGVLLRTRLGGPALRAKGPARVAYVLRPQLDRRPPAEIRPAGLAWPRAYRQALDRVAGLAPAEKAARLSDWLNYRFRYTRDPRAARRFQRASGSWLARATAIGAGDCDVVNGVMTLMLQSAGVPARLHIGLVGEGGAARPELHAWVVFWNGDYWQFLDLTARFRVVSRPISGVASAAGPEAPPEATTAGPSALASQSPVERREGTGLTLARAAEPTPSTATPWPLVFLLALILALAVWAIMRRRNVLEPDKVDPDFAVDLFRYAVQTGGGEQGFGMRFRPLLPTHDGRRLSYVEARQLAERSRLFVCRPGLPLLRDIHGGDRALNGDAPAVRKLKDYLPPALPLDALAPALEASVMPESLRQTEMRIRQLDRHFRLYLAPDSDALVEARLPFKRAGRGRRQVFLGERHPICRNLAARFTAAPALAIFQAVQALLNQTTFYLAEKDAFLQRLARRIETETP